MFDGIRRRLALNTMKAVTLPWVPKWARAAWPDITFRQLVDEGYKVNAAVFSCVNYHVDAFPEAPLYPYEERDGDFEKLPDAPIRQLLAEPNPEMGEKEFWGYCISYQAIGGNAYVWKRRSTANRVVELWPLHDGQVAPVPGMEKWISHYEYHVQGHDPIMIPREDIIHLRWAPDPMNPIRGMSPLQAIARDVMTVNEAIRYQYALLKNDAAPRTIVGVSGGLSDAAFERMKEQWQERYGGDHRGDVAITDGELTVQRIGMNLEELAIQALFNVPESHIASAFRVPPILVGLNVGLQRSTLANFREAREAYTEEFRLPRWAKVASQVTTQLYRQDFAASTKQVLMFDTAQVRALAEDEQAKRGSLNAALAWTTVNEARMAMGLEHLGPAGDVFIRSNASDVVPMHDEPMMALALPAQPVPPPPMLEDSTEDDAEDEAENDEMKARRLSARLARRRQRLDQIDIADMFADDILRELQRVQKRIADRVEDWED